MDGDASYVELLINNGMSPSTCDYNQRTPLHLAASNGHTHIVHFLCNQAVCPTSLSESVDHGLYRLAGVSFPSNMLSARECTVDIGIHVSNAQICPVSIDCSLARDLLSRCRSDDQGKAAFPLCSLLKTRAHQDTSYGCEHRYATGTTILLLFTV